jgi:four helix bundle protein
MTSKELQERLTNFALRIVPMCEKLPNTKMAKIIEDQLLRSGFSAAANYRSACNAQSDKAFISKLSIALEEIDETTFWLETVLNLKYFDEEKIGLLLKESIELTKILGASRRTARLKKATTPN